MTVLIDAHLVALRAAFAPSPLDAKGAFAWESDAELCERAVHGKTWDEVDLRVIARSDVLAFLDADRFVAWLPMYLKHLVLGDPARSGRPRALLGGIRLGKIRE